jgi:hypothetical protein
MTFRLTVLVLVCCSSELAMAYDVRTHRSMSSSSAFESVLAKDRRVLASLGLDPRYFSDPRFRLPWGIGALLCLLREGCGWSLAP